MKIIVLIALIYSGISYSQIYFNEELINPIGIEYADAIALKNNGNYLITGALRAGSDKNLFILEVNNFGATIISKRFQFGYDINPMWDCLIGLNESYYSYGWTNQIGVNGFLTKINPTEMDTVWFQTYDHPIHDTLSFTIYNGKINRKNQIITSGTYEDQFQLQNFSLTLFDTTGTLLWNQHYAFGPWSIEQAYSVDTCFDGGYIMAGYTSAKNGSNWDLPDIAILKTDSLGLEQWSRTIGGAGDDVGFVKSSKYGGYYIYGGYINETTNKSTAYVGKLDELGNTVWDTLLENFPNSHENLTSCIELENGDIVLTGTTFNGTNTNPLGWLVKMDSTGQVLWERRIEKRQNDNYFSHLIQTPDNGFAICGTVFPDGGLTQDIWVVKTDELGCYIPGCTLGVEELTSEENQLKAYPNPFVNELHLSWELILPKTIIEISDLSGKYTYQMEMAPMEQKITLFKNQHFKGNGMYFIRLISQGEVYGTRKVVVE